MWVLEIFNQKIKNLHPLTVILFFGAFHGVLYLWIVPPWQHYDEPTHFEYAWWVANSGTLPEEDSYNSEMRREVAASMVEYNFFENLPAPNLLLTKPWIGISQTEDQPLYYLIIAIPLWLLKGTEVTTQLYAARFVSFGMFLLTVAFCYLITKELFPAYQPLHWLFPLALVLNPAFVELMTAVNNDVGATLFFSIFLWVGVKLLIRGFNFYNIIIFVLLIIICYWTKNTVYIAIPTGIMLFLLSIFQLPSPWHRLAFPVIFIFVFAAAFYLFSWKDAAYWYRGQFSVQQNVPTQFHTQGGKEVLIIDYSPAEDRELTLTQPLISSSIAVLAGKSYSLGAWMWASESVQIRIPTLSIDGKKTFQLAELTQTPAFYSQTGIVPSDAIYAHILIDPLANRLDHSVKIYFDNIILAEGEFPDTQIPDLLESDNRGIWNNKEFINLLQNPTFEATWLTFTPSIQDQIQTSIPPYALTAMQDYQLTNAFYQFASTNLFKSFWGRFGWNQVSLPKNYFFILAGFTLIGLLGNFDITTKLKNANRDVALSLIWFLICTLLVWIAALARQNLPFWNGPIFTPSARYAFPAIIPTSMGIISGWYLISRRVGSTRILSYLPIAFLVILDITSLIVNLQFYHST